MQLVLPTLPCGRSYHPGEETRLGADYAPGALGHQGQDAGGPVREGMEPRTQVRQKRLS